MGRPETTSETRQPCQRIIAGVGLFCACCLRTTPQVARISKATLRDNLSGHSLARFVTGSAGTASAVVAPFSPCANPGADIYFSLMPGFCWLSFVWLYPKCHVLFLAGVCYSPYHPGAIVVAAPGQRWHHRCLTEHPCHLTYAFLRQFFSSIHQRKTESILEAGFTA